MKLRYKTPAGGASKLDELVGRDSDLRLQQAPPDLHFGSAVAAFGMLLRDSPYRGHASFAQVLELAGSARGDGRERELRDEFVELVRSASRLSDGSDER